MVVIVIATDILLESLISYKKKPNMNLLVVAGTVF